MDANKIIKESFKNYAGATIMERAIVDVRDALKPSARVGLYAQYLEKILPTKPYQKALKSVSAGLSRFYTHGDVSLYNLLIRMGKPWATRYLLEDVQGSTGTIQEGDNHAAARYVEMRLSPLSMSLFKGIEKESIEKWYENYSADDYYPAVLPSLGYYNIVNGTTGIATALASSIPQFNLKEVNEAMCKIIDNPDVDFSEIYCPPDFATGATIVNGEEVKESLRVGSGSSCRLRSTIRFDEDERAFVVTEIPYGVHSSTIASQVLDIIESDENPGIDRVLDLSGTTPLIKIYLQKGMTPTRILKYLYKKTSLEHFFGINMVMLDNGKAPKIFGWKEALTAHIQHEIKVLTNIYIFDLKTAEGKLNLVEGIIKAISIIEEVIATIRGADGREQALAGLGKLGFNRAQAEGILKITLGRLVRLELSKYQKEAEELRTLISSLKEKLDDKSLLLEDIKKEMREVASKFGDDRRTKIMSLTTADADEPVEIKELIVSLTTKNNLLINESSSLYSQSRGTVGVKSKLGKGEYTISAYSFETGDTLKLFTSKGNVFTIDPHDVIDETKIHLPNLIDLEQNERVIALEKLENEFLTIVTKNGILKKSLKEEYSSRRKGKIRAIILSEGDEVVSAFSHNEGKIGILSSTGNLVVIESDGIRPIGRDTKGVIGMTLKDAAEVVTAKFIPAATQTLLTIATNGKGKRTMLDEFSVTKRGARGVIAQTAKDADISDFLPLDNQREFVVVTPSRHLKIRTNEVSLTGRSTQGVKIVEIKSNEKLYLLNI